MFPTAGFSGLVAPSIPQGYFRFGNLCLSLWPFPVLRIYKGKNGPSWAPMESLPSR